MKSETPITDSLLKTGTNAEQLCEALDRSRQLERKLIKLTNHVKLSLDNEKYGPCEWEAWNEKAKRLINQ